jgi:hypothetical protein
MENGSLIIAFSAWEMIAVCVLFMLLLPLIFFIASARRRPRLQLPVKEKVITGAPARAVASKPLDEKENEVREPGE